MNQNPKHTHPIQPSPQDKAHELFDLLVRAPWPDVLWVPRSESFPPWVPAGTPWIAVVDVVKFCVHSGVAPEADGEAPMSFSRARDITDVLLTLWREKKVDLAKLDGSEWQLGKTGMLEVALVRVSRVGVAFFELTQQAKALDDSDRLLQHLAVLARAVRQ